MREKRGIGRVNDDLYLLVVAFADLLVDDALDVVLYVVLGALVVNHKKCEIWADEVRANE